MTNVTTTRGATQPSQPVTGRPAVALASTESASVRMGEDSLARRAERVVGLKASPLSPKALGKEVKLGVLSSIPVEALMLSQAYRRGDIDAKTYAATTLSNSVSFGSWTVGGALVGSLIPGGTLIGGALGFAGGMLSQSVWNRTLGKHVTSFFKSLIPEGAAKAFADTFNRFVANPLTDYVWKPVSGFVKRNKVLSGAVGAGALLLLPAPLRMGLLKVGATMAGGTALGMAADAFVLDKFLPKAPETPGHKQSEAPRAQSALGAYDAELKLDEQSRQLVHQSFPQVFPPGASLQPGLQSDLEKVFYIKLAALTARDPLQAQQLEATFQSLAGQVDAYWNGGRQVAPPSGNVGGLQGRTLTG